MTKPLIIIGAGGHARVVLDLALALGRAVAGLTDTDPARHGERVRGIEVLGDDATVLDRVAPDACDLALGIGAGGADLVAALSRRLDIAEAWESEGYAFPSLVHPSAVLAGDCNIENGAQVMAGAVVQPGAAIGRHAIINTRAGVDHDTTVHNGAHIAPGATLGGGVTVGRCAYVGLGASIVHALSVGDEALVAAGASVVDSVSARTRVGGVPAKEMASWP